MTEPNAGAIQGLRVIDLTRVLGGPFCTQLLGDHGADVIKVEPPQGDEVRDWGPPFHDADASYFIGVNRNKRSIALDLSQEAGREVLLALLENADVLIENYKPGTLARWGIGYETLSERFPRLIHCRISGFGGDGPLGRMPGYDAIVQAMTGMFSINGEPETGATRIGIPLVDLGTGLYSAIGILMALHERTRSGKGQFLDMTLFDCGLALMHPHFANYHLSGKVPGLTGNHHPNVSPYDKYRTKTCDIFVGIGNNRAFRRLCEALGASELAEDPRFATNADRLANRDALSEALKALLLQVEGQAFAEELLAKGVPVGPVLDSAAAVDHVQTRHRAMVVNDDWYKGTASPVKMSRTPAQVRHKPPQFSEHARTILAEHGFDEAAIERLAESGVVCEQRRTV